ncbi:MAG: threonine synthase [Oscillospiraceae bacterium]|jgi:threonine synthase
MRYLSTRDAGARVTSAEAIIQGLAPDGGLYTPEMLPRLPGRALSELTDMNYRQRAVYVMSGFLEDFTIAELTDFANKAYNAERFDHPEVAPIHSIDDTTHFLELWHGPTAAFKDMALQMLPHFLSASLVKRSEEKTACILVATSGDTGKAALEGFCDVDRTKILVFYPKDGVSAIQELQMVSQSGRNVGVCAVVGNFDDAQSGVKSIFSDEKLRSELASRGYFLSSANSINWGRVLPQIVYYISAYCDLVKQGKIALRDEINICVPTGNFGNILAAYYAKQMGLPVKKLICASNQNNVLTDFLKTGVYDRNRRFYNTISPSMDILISSNLERLLYSLCLNDREVTQYMQSLKDTGRYKISSQMFRRISEDFAAGYCTEEGAMQVIRATHEKYGYLIDPHTSVAFEVLLRYRHDSGDRTPAVIASTASPYKFCDSVLISLGEEPVSAGVELIDQLYSKTGAAVPAPLAALKHKKPRFNNVADKERMADVVKAFLR